jgi:hypothetical protein
MSNLNKVRREKIIVTLNDDKEYEILFTLNAMADLEEKYGTVDKAFKALEDKSFVGIRFMLATALGHYEGMDIKKVGNLIDMNNIGDIMQALADAFGQDVDVEDENKDPNEQSL